MHELISITTDSQGRSVVSARELYTFLEVKARFNDWFKRRINEFDFLAGQKYTIWPEGFYSNLSKTPAVGGRPEIDYALSLDMAKELSMVERTEKGKQARQYFIDAEKALRRLTAHPRLLEQDRRIAELEQKLSRIVDTQQQAARALLELPRSDEALPEETTRIKIQRIVNAYCRAKHIDQQAVWRRVYGRLYYLYHINIRAHQKRLDRESWLDVAERKGYLDKLYAIVSAELVLDR